VLNISQNNWRIGSSEEIDLLIKHENMVRHIKTRRIRWIIHIVKTDKERMMTSVAEWRAITVRGIGRKRLRWAGDVRKDLG
jgi:hypothetical protein